jgi:hypothetical protein
MSIMAKAKPKKAVVRHSLPSAAKYPRSTLVRPIPVEDAEELAAEDKATSAEAAAEETPKPVVALSDVVSQRRPAPALNPARVASPKAEKGAQAERAVRTGRVAVRSATQQMVSRRSAIRAENYGYVIKDLRMIVGIAVAMVVIVIVLRVFVKI